MVDIVIILFFAGVSVCMIGMVLVTNQPDAYTSHNRKALLDDSFTDEDKKTPESSGYAYFLKQQNENGTVPIKSSVQVVVLGDIGRSPRMQNHALSIAAHGGKVDVIGYVDSPVHPALEAHALIDITALPRIPRALQTNSRLLFLLLGPLKVLFQTLTLYLVLAYEAPASRWMVLQNPPSIPTLLVARLVCRQRYTRLAIDWHNLGHTLLAFRLGATSPLVRLAAWHDRTFARGATAHFAVSHAMVRHLRTSYNITALPLHDRPTAHFHPLPPSSRKDFLTTLPLTAPHAPALATHSTRLLIAPTSWTPDEDFALLLSALQTYAAATKTQSPTPLPSLLAIITGTGPLKPHFTSLITSLQTSGALPNVTILTTFLPAADYASLLASADLGVSLHTSSSGLDLPMKVVDMFGAGLPVVGWSQYEAWPELVREGVNGRGFESAEELAGVLGEVLGGKGEGLEKLRVGAGREAERGWEAVWEGTAGRVLEVLGEGAEGGRELAEGKKGA